MLTRQHLPIKGLFGCCPLVFERERGFGRFLAEWPGRRPAVASYGAGLLARPRHSQNLLRHRDMGLLKAKARPFPAGPSSTVRACRSRCLWYTKRYRAKKSGDIKQPSRLPLARSPVGPDPRQDRRWPFMVTHGTEEVDGKVSPFSESTCRAQRNALLKNRPSFHVPPCRFFEELTLLSKTI
jgi:hypothetical protein